MISKEFEFFAPVHEAGVLELLDQHGAHATLLAGGMSLVPAMNLGLVEPERLISLNHVTGLDQAVEQDRVLRLGAMLRHVEVARNPLIQRWCPALSTAAGVIGDVQVRHRGTLGGSVAHADPAADYPPVLVAAGAAVRLRSIRGERSVPAGEFFVDLMLTSRAPSELLVEITIPKPAPTARSAHVRFARVEGSFPIVTVAALVDPAAGSIRVGLGGIGPRPVLIELTEDLSDGLTEGALARLAEAAHQASGQAYGDLHADPEYRRAMACVFTQRAVKSALNGARR
ncbi:MAG TPA: xanthine dehydrogenase family protein subunit M [Candidatus Limnocylindria bacterium]|nr:xanthine dehydrogenase family protein subunit M [Candidatus Limnocylindria bacterium]